MRQNGAKRRDGVDSLTKRKEKTRNMVIVDRSSNPNLDKWKPNLDKFSFKHKWISNQTKRREKKCARNKTREFI